MREAMEARLAELREERERGERMLTDLQARQAELRDTLLRISGAIQVLEEHLSAGPPRDALQAPEA